MKRKRNIEEDNVLDIKDEVIEFIKKYDLKVTPVGFNKNPIEKDWNNPAVFEPKQEEYIKGFIQKTYNLGFICGIKTERGYFFVCDVDSKPVYDKIFKKYQGMTTQVKSGGPKECSYHFYFFSKYPVKTFRIHKKITNKKGDITDVGLDVQGTNTQVLTPMSIHPLTNKPYKFICKKEPMCWDGDVEMDLNKEIEDAFGIMVEYETVNITELLETPLKDHEGRDNAAIRIATWHRINGKTEDEALKLLTEWNQKNIEPLDDETLRMKVRSAYSPDKPYGWKFIEVETFTKEEQEKADWLLKNPEYLLFYIHEAGKDIVREDKNKILIPILEFGKQSMEISGKSAAGKNHLIDCISRYFPKEWFKKITGMTNKALRYLNEKYQTIYIAERRGIESSSQETTAEYDMKVGISENEIVTIYPARNELTGEIELKEKHVKVGNFIMTTTEVAPPPELENRIFNLTVDESEEQNKLVRDFILQQASLPSNKRINTEKEKKILRCLFDKINKNSTDKIVIIPFARILSKLLPANDASIRRHTTKLIKLIETVAKLFEAKLPIVKDKNGVECIIATPELFWYVWQIGNEAIFTQIIRMTKREIEIWRIMEKMFTIQEIVTTKDLANAAKISTRMAMNYFDSFDTKGFITTTREHGIKVAELRKKNDSEKEKFTNLTMKELVNEYENAIKNLRAEALEVGGYALILVDPFSGEKKRASELPNFRLDSSLFKINITEKGKTLKYTGLERFDNVVKG